MGWKQEKQAKNLQRNLNRSRDSSLDKNQPGIRMDVSTDVRTCGQFERFATGGPGNL